MTVFVAWIGAIISRLLNLGISCQYNIAILFCELKSIFNDILRVNAYMSKKVSF